MGKLHITSMGPTGLSWGLVAQLRDTNFGIPADVTFHFGDDDDFEMIEDDIVDDDVKAHRMILALASDKFKDMLYTPHDDNNDVKIENISKSVFSAMISFIYGTSTDLQALNICELMELRDVSKDYKVAGLAQATQDTIERFSVTEDNLFETVKDILDIEADSEEMIQHCAMFIKSNLKNNEIDGFIESLDQNKTMSENISRAIGNLTPPPCNNCLATPCLNNTTIPNTNNMIPGCKVAVMNCADNTGGKNLYVIAVYGIRGRLNRLPAACSGDMVLATVKKGKPELRKKVMPAVVIRQRKTFRRKDGQFIYFEDNAGVIVNNKGEMKGSAITGPVSKECADLWPRIASNAGSIA